MHLTMVRKITITEEAYERLRRLKGKDDSFSKVIVRVSEGKTDLRRFLGILSGEKELVEARKRIREIRKRVSRDIEKRRKSVLGS